MAFDPLQGQGVPISQVDPTSAGQSGPALIAGAAPALSDPQLIEMFTRWKRESFDQRHVFERQWLRNIWYLLNRQWIYFDARKGQWQDKRLAKWIPRPVTNICLEAVQTVRANFAAINYGANAKPLGDDNINVITADVVDDYGPILHGDHNMDAVMNEFDFWMLGTGNAWLHTCIDYDRKNGMVDEQSAQCLSCQAESTDSQIVDAGQKCPACGSPNLQPVIDPQTGQPKVTQTILPKGICIPLSPFEIAFPLMYERYDLAPYTIRMRWRDKTYYEQHEELKAYAGKLNFGKTPTERTMQIFKTLPFQNDLGVSSPFFAAGGANAEAEGIVEYDVWVKPCADFPEGQVIRFAGDSSPVVIHSEKEGLPGPLPYKDSKGNPIFTFHHGRYNTIGGRPLGSSLIDPAIQIQDVINQIDSHALMIIGRMANPVWLEPKGAEVEKFTGEPGLVVKWNPLVAGGNAKPERIPGEGINQSVFEFRALKKQEAEELMGTFDIMKGQKPGGVEAYASLNFLNEKGQARHTNAFKERGSAYKGWFGDAIAIEQQFGPNERVRAMMMPNRAWAFETFKKADLRGSVEIMIEDGTLLPKTSLGERAAIEHLRTLGLLNPSDPEQVMAIYTKFGQQSLLPGLDAQVQEANMVMDKFEKFIADPMAIQAALAQPMDPNNPMPGPLVYRRWYNPQIHRQELVKWCLSDRGRSVFEKFPQSMQYVDAYLTQIDLAIAQAQMGVLDAGGVMINTKPAGAPGGGPPGAEPGQGAPGGPGAAMANSQRNAGGVGPTSSGAGGTAQPQQ